MSRAPLTSALTLLALTLSAPQAARAQETLVFDITQSQSNFTWSGTTSIGPIVGNPSNAFQLAGTQVLDVVLQPGAQPVASAAFNGGAAAAIPDIHGRIPNVLPFLPPLATIDVLGLVFSTSSPSFAVAGGGSFSTDVVLTVLAGTMVVTPLGGAPATTDLAGSVSNPTPLSGTLTLVAGELRLSEPLNSTFPFSDPGTGISGSITVVGTLNARYVLVRAYCSGDGTGTACPCGNLGGAGRGCANSVEAQGALLSASGAAVVSADSFVLTASGLPTTTTGLFFQGTTQTAAGLGAVFGDGLRCASGAIVRLGTKVASAGSASYPQGADLAVSVRGLLPAAGGTRNYQCWYRNSAAFCSAATYNLSNGLRVTWRP